MCKKKKTKISTRLAIFYKQPEIRAKECINSPTPSSLPTSNLSLNQSFLVSLGIDFTFNTIKNVKKVAWKEDAPWYREISDGFCWLCYCQNPKCFANR